MQSIISRFLETIINKSSSLVQMELNGKQILLTTMKLEIIA
ncbi:MAG: hypothetical protein ACTS7E_02595 [Arsenophonus sp. NC-CH8-MAG3]